jgi:hypothetical protein
VPKYLVEAYVGRPDAPGLGRVSRRARTSAATLTEAGGPVRYLGAISIPGDELCFHVYAGPSAAAVSEAAKRAGIAAERIVEAVQLGWDADAAVPGDGPA